LDPLINIIKKKDGHFVVEAENGVPLGELLQDVDGYLYFFPEIGRGGFWPSHMLRAIADKLDELNKPWNEEIGRMLDDADAKATQDRGEGGGGSKAEGKAGD